MVGDKVNKKDGEYMRKYIYLFGIIYSFFTFMIGWNHYQENGFDIFNVGMMAITAILAFVFGFDWASEQTRKMEEEECDTIDMEITND